jgi:hypothetical protein
MLPHVTRIVFYRLPQIVFEVDVLADQVEAAVSAVAEILVSPKKVGYLVSTDTRSV